MLSFPFQIQSLINLVFSSHLLIVSPPRKSCCILACLILSPENLAWQPSDWGSRVWPCRSVHCTPFVARFGQMYLWVASCVQLLVIFASGSGSQEDSIFCTLCGDRYLLCPRGCSVLLGILLFVLVGTRLDI